MKKVYISGPMLGKKYYNTIAFFEAESKLEGLGFTTFNPSKIDAENGANYLAFPADYDWDSLPEGFDFKACRLRDINELEDCDGIYMLRGWENSAGAKAEYYYALWAGKDIMPEASVYMWEGTAISKEQYHDNIKKELEEHQKVNPKLKLEDEPDIPPPIPKDSAKRKEYPLYRGLFKYFPHALCAIAHHSYKNNEKHNPGEELHWSRGKSDDHRDAEMRHVLEDDWVAHGWRALAILQLHLESKLKD